MSLIISYKNSLQTWKFFWKVEFLSMSINNKSLVNILFVQVILNKYLFFQFYQTVSKHLSTGHLGHLDTRIFSITIDFTFKRFRMIYWTLCVQIWSSIVAFQKISNVPHGLPGECNVRRYRYIFDSKHFFLILNETYSI